MRFRRLVEVELEIQIALDDNPLKLNELLLPSLSPQTGACVSFVGVVRDKNKGKPVDYMVYTAQKSMCEKLMRESAEEAFEKYELTRLLCVHRLGQVNISEPSVVVLTESVHRQAAYDANRDLIEKFKFLFPIWKEEFYRDGSSAWV